MRLSSATAVAAGGLALSGWMPTASAWGAAGHEIIATIAQIHLHPSVLPTVCSLLDVDVDLNDDPSVLRSKCHISSIATWADKYRMRMRWSAAMHYVGAVDDFPRDRCEFPGQQGWAGSRSINVLDGMKNVTKILAEWSGVDENDLEYRGPRSSSIPGPLQEEAFKFLVHFVGDMHQPLHLTGRARGGNGIKVHFGRRFTNLHSVWDTSIPAKLIREVPRNYTHPLPDLSLTSEPSLTSSYYALDDDYPGYIPPTSAQIESGLRGTIYDALIRRIMWEGVRGRWGKPQSKDEPSSEIDTWGICPPLSTVPVLRAPLKGEVMQEPFQFTPAPRVPIPIDPDGPLICPYAWSRPIHTLNCDYIWPEGVKLTEESDQEHAHHHAEDVLNELLEEEIAQDDFFNPPRTPRPPHDEYPDLDVPSYMGPLEQSMVVEKLMAQGGLRLAGIINWLFADWEE